MTDQNKPLLVRFKESSSMLGTSRETLKQCAEKLGVTETAAVHIAINRLYIQLFPEKIAEVAPADEQIAAQNTRNAVTEANPVVKSVSIADVIGA